LTPQQVVANKEIEKLARGRAQDRETFLLCVKCGCDPKPFAAMSTEHGRLCNGCYNTITNGRVVYPVDTVDLLDLGSPVALGRHKILLLGMVDGLRKQLKAL